MEADGARRSELEAGAAAGGGRRPQLQRQAESGGGMAAWGAGTVVVHLRPYPKPEARLTLPLAHPTLSLPYP